MHPSEGQPPTVVSRGSGPLQWAAWLKAKRTSVKPVPSSAEKGKTSGLGPVQKQASGRPQKPDEEKEKIGGNGHKKAELRTRV